MAEKTLKTRIIHKHETETNWKKSNFVPKQGELIVYDIDENYTYERFKIGDGVTNVNDLPFKGAGEETPEGGEIFNDYENNQAISSNAHAEGKGTFAGTKTFNIERYYQYSTVFVMKLDSLNGLEIGDVVSIKFNANYDMIAPIVAIAPHNDGELVLNSNEIAISATITPDKEKGILWVPHKPHIGTFSYDSSQHAEGLNTKAVGGFSHAEGYDTLAAGRYAHAEGKGTVAVFGAHAEGDQTKALGEASHTEGRLTEARSDMAHAEGYFRVASGEGAHAEGYGIALQDSNGNYYPANFGAEARGSHVEGCNTRVMGDYAHAEGMGTFASGEASHAEGVGEDNINIVPDGKDYGAKGYASHVEGYKTLAKGKTTHAEGSQTKASGNYSHSEGKLTDATGEASHAEGYLTNANGAYTHTEGNNTTANGEASHAEGHTSYANGDISHAEGRHTIASGNYSHAEGNTVNASAEASHAEGYSTKAEGNTSHAEGNETHAIGLAAHSEGYKTVAKGRISHAEGIGTIASSRGQHVGGMYNEVINPVAGPDTSSDSDAIYIIGNGNSDTDRSNAFVVYKDGHAEVDKMGETNNSIATKAYVDKNKATIDMQTMVDMMYPIGSVYISLSETNPFANYGTWAPISNMFLVGKNHHDNGEIWFDYLGETKITAPQVPYHSHGIDGLTIANDGKTIAAGSDIHGVINVQNGTYSEGTQNAKDTLPPYMVVNMWQRIS